MCKRRVMVAAVCLAAALAAASARAGDKYQTSLFSASAKLADRADANSLAAAAALRFAGSLGAPRGSAPKMQNSAVELAARAIELEPQNASIGWLHLQLCVQTPACDIRDAATTMRWVDSDNAAAWLATLAIAQKDKDTVEVERILSDMALGVRFDLYWNRIIVLIADALYAVRRELPAGFASSDDARLATAEAVAGAEIVPKFSPLIDACRESVSERRELCLRLAKAMQRGDTVVAQLAGLSIEKRVRSAEGKDSRAIAERRHVLEWRQAQVADADRSVLSWTRNARARVRLAHMHILPREEDVLIATLKERHLPLEPPEFRP